MKKALIVALLCAPLALAADPGIISFSGGTEYTIYHGGSTGDVVGWKFRVEEDVVVTHLGAYEDTRGGMNTPHQVGIWDMNQNLVVDATVDPSDPLEGQFRFTSIANTALTTGSEYVIGALYTSDDDDWYISSASTADVDPAITWLDSRYPASGSLGFTFPASVSSSIGRFGPNFKFVPEPASLALLALGFVLRRR